MTDDTLRRRAARFYIPNPVVQDVALEPVLDGAPGHAEIPRPSAPRSSPGRQVSFDGFEHNNPHKTDREPGPLNFNQSCQSVADMFWHHIDAPIRWLRCRQLPPLADRENWEIVLT